MSKRKFWIINPLDSEDILLRMDWGDYAFLVYYGSKISVLKTLTLMRLLRGETHFEMASELPISEPINNSEELTISFNSLFLQEAIDFLNDEIIPALEEEPEYILVEKYDGVNELESLILSDTESILDVISVFEEWYTMSLSTLTYIGELATKIGTKS